MIFALNATRRLNDITPDIYNQESKAKRSFHAMFISINELSSPAWIDETAKSTDALALYVVTATDNERAEAMTKARQLTRERALILVAIPRNNSNLEDAYRRYRACRSLRLQQEYGSEEYQKLLRDDGFVGKDYYNQFNIAYNFFIDPGNLEWFWQGEVRGNIQQPIHLIRFASDVMKQVYSKGVLHNQQQHLAIEKVNSAGKKAIDAILGSNISVKTTGKKAAEEAVLVDGAAAMGLIQISGTEKGYQKYTVTPPTKGPSKEVWATIAKHFNSGVTDLEALIQELQMPPFGLYPPVIALFLAAFYQQNSDAIDIYRGAGSYPPISVTSEEIIGIITSPKSYRVSYRVASETETLYLRGIIEQVLFPGKTISNAYSSSTGSLKVAVARSLKDWSQETGALVRSLNESAFTNIGGLAPQQATIAVGIIRLGLMQSDTGVIIQALLKDIPEVLDRLPVWESTVEQAQDLLQELIRISQTVVKFEDVFAESILLEIADVFNATAYSRENREPLYESARIWFNEHAVIDPNTLNDKYAVGLFYALKGLISLQSLKPVFLKDLPNRYDLEPVNHWSDVAYTDRYIRFVQSAKIKIESQLKLLTQSSTSNSSHTENDIYSATSTDLPSVEKSSQPIVSIPPQHIPSSESNIPPSEPKPPSEPYTTPRSFGNSTDKMFADDPKLERVARRIISSIADEDLTQNQRARLIDELARRYGSR